jgi:hypothetical protein
MRLLFCIATIGSAGLSGAALAQSMPSYQIAQDVHACSNRETMERFIKIEGTGNRAAKLRADLLRRPLIRGECHILPPASKSISTKACRRRAVWFASGR